MFTGQASMDSDKLLMSTQLSLDIDDVPIPDAPYTLEEFSVHYFNPPPKKTLTKTLSTSIRKIKRDIPWAFSKVCLLCCMYL